jgi:hypothetical protein
MNAARPWAGTKKNKETTENTEHAEKQIDFFREFRAFRSCQKLIVVERLSGNVFPLFAVSSADVLPFRQIWISSELRKTQKDTTRPAGASQYCLASAHFIRSSRQDKSTQLNQNFAIFAPLRETIKLLTVTGL